MSNPKINYGKDIRENYGENTVAVQVRDVALFFNTLLILNDNEVAVVRNNGNGDKNVFDTSGTIINPDNRGRLLGVTDKTGKYTITYFDTKPREASVSICDDVRVECQYRIINPERVLENLLFDSHKDYSDRVRIHTASDGSIIKLIKGRVTNPISGKIDKWKEERVLLKKVGEINSLIKECLESEDVLERTGLKIEHVNVLIDRTKSKVAVTQTQEEPSKQPERSVEEIKAVVKSEFKGAVEKIIANQDKNTEKSMHHNSELAEDIKATTKSEAEKGRLHTSKEAEGINLHTSAVGEDIKDFIAERDGIIKDILENVKTGKGSGVSSEDIKKYFDITNATVAAEINKLIDKINAGKHLSDEEFVQATKAVECTDPKDLKNTPQLTLNFILDNTSKDWHASMAADVIYHQLEKWLSKKKITSAMFKAEELLEFFKRCPKEVFYENGDCILDKSFKKTGSEIAHKLFEQGEWVLLKDVKGRIKPHNGLKCYFALLDNDAVNSDSKNAIYQCKKAGKYWGQMNAMRHFGTEDSKNKLSMQGLSDVKARKERLIEITEFFKTGVFETEDVLADII